MVKGMKDKERDVNNTIKERVKEMGLEKVVEEKRKEEWRRIIGEKLRNMKKKKELMKKKEILGRGIRIDDDLIWRGRKMRWKLGEIAKKERKKEKRVGIEYEKINIDGEWWKWKEREKRLKKV